MLDMNEILEFTNKNCIEEVPITVIDTTKEITIAGKKYTPVSDATLDYLIVNGRMYIPILIKSGKMLSTIGYVTDIKHVRGETDLKITGIAKLVISNDKIVEAVKNMDNFEYAGRVNIKRSYILYSVNNILALNLTDLDLKDFDVKELKMKTRDSRWKQSK